MLNVCKAIFFFSYYWLNNRAKKEDEKLQQQLKANIENQLKQGMANMMMNKNATPETPNPEIQQLKLKYEEEIHGQEKKQALLVSVEEAD